MSSIDLYIVTGCAGTGKTTAGEKVARSLNTNLFEPDQMRRELGITQYNPADTTKVMSEIFDKIEYTLANLRKPAVLATTYGRRIAREQSYDLLTRISEDIGEQLTGVLIHCHCIETVAKTRIAARPVTNNLHSPGNNPAIYDRYKRRDEPISEEEIFQNPHMSFLDYDSETSKLSPISVRTTHIQGINNLAHILN